MVINERNSTIYLLYIHLCIELNKLSFHSVSCVCYEFELVIKFSNNFLVLFAFVRLIYNGCPGKIWEYKSYLLYRKKQYSTRT